MVLDGRRNGAVEAVGRGGEHVGHLDFGDAGGLEPMDGAGGEVAGAGAQDREQRLFGIEAEPLPRDLEACGFEPASAAAERDMDARRPSEGVAAGHGGAQTATGLQLRQRDDRQRPALVGGADAQAMTAETAHRVLFQPDQQLAAAGRGEAGFGDGDVGEVARRRSGKQRRPGRAQPGQLLRQAFGVDRGDFRERAVAGDVDGGAAIGRQKDRSGEAAVLPREAGEIVSRAGEDHVAAARAEPGEPQFAPDALPQHDQREDSGEYGYGAAAQPERETGARIGGEARLATEADEETQRLA